jgi:hypothetical protein
MNNNNLDSYSIAGFAINYSLYVASLMQFESVTRIVLMIISGVAGLTTIFYNYKKMQK